MANPTTRRDLPLDSPQILLIIDRKCTTLDEPARQRLRHLDQPVPARIKPAFVHRPPTVPATMPPLAPRRVEQGQLLQTHRSSRGRVERKDTTKGERRRT